METVKQGSIITSSIIGGIYGIKLSTTPCLKIGSLNPTIAYYTVPICIASRSLIGGVIATNAHRREDINNKEEFVKVEFGNGLSCKITKTNDNAIIGRCNK